MPIVQPCHLYCFHDRQNWHNEVVNYGRMGGGNEPEDTIKNISSGKISKAKKVLESMVFQLNSENKLIITILSILHLTIWGMWG